MEEMTRLLLVHHMPCLRVDDAVCDMPSLRVVCAVVTDVH